MKNLSTLRYLLFALFVTASACGDDEKKDDPTPKTIHTVEVEYFTENITPSLGARLSSVSTLPDGTQPANVNQVDFTAVSNGSYTTEVNPDRDFAVTVSFMNVRPATSVPSGTLLRAFIKVDGVQRRIIQVSNVTPATPVYPTVRYVILASEW